MTASQPASQPDRQTDGRKDGRTDRKAGKKTCNHPAARPTNGRLARHTLWQNRQTDRHTLTNHARRTPPAGPRFCRADRQTHSDESRAKRPTCRPGGPRFRKARRPQHIRPGARGRRRPPCAPDASERRRGGTAAGRCGLGASGPVVQTKQDPLFPIPSRMWPGRFRFCEARHSIAGTLCMGVG
jgi:hypothetical protein